MSRSSHSPVLRHRIVAPVLGLGLGLLSGCAQIPELDATVPDYLDDADYPPFVELDPSLTTPTSPDEDADALEKQLAARRDALQDKARRLNTPVIAPSTQERMQTGITE